MMSPTGKCFSALFLALATLYAACYTLCRTDSISEDPNLVCGWHEVVNRTNGCHSLVESSRKLDRITSVEEFLCWFFSTSPHSNNDVYPEPYASLFSMTSTILRTPSSSPKYIEAVKELDDLIAKKKYHDYNFDQLIKLLSNVQPIQKPSSRGIEKERECYDTLWKIYEKQCGPGLDRKYGLDLEHFAVVVHMCEAGVTPDQMDAAATEVCGAQLNASF